MLGSFGASCVLVFAYPDVPFSQPRNVVIGHVLSTATGLVFLSVFGPHWWSMAMALGTAIALMMIIRTVHPPAGSNPIIVFLALPTWKFVLFPTLVGALLLVAMSHLFIITQLVMEDIRSIGSESELTEIKNYALCSV